MPEYRYRAINDNGEPHKGTMAADSEAHLETILNKGGYYLLEAAEVQAIVKSTAHKPDIVDPEEENWQQGSRMKPPGGGELHLHKHEHAYAGAPRAKWSALAVASLVIGSISILWSSFGFIPQFLVFSLAVMGAEEKGEKIKGVEGALAVLFANPVFYLCLAAIITGYMALSRCRRRGLRGGGLAIAGLITGGLAIWGPIIIALFFW